MRRLIKVPEVTPENHRELEAYGMLTGSKRGIATVEFVIASALFHPKVVVTKKAAEALPATTADPDCTNVIAGMHLSNADPLNLAAMIWRIKSLKALRGSVAISSKTDLSSGPSALRWYIEGVDSFTTFGKRDRPKTDDPNSPELKLYHDAIASSKRLKTWKMLHTRLFGDYPTGTRGNDPFHVDPLTTGLAESVLEIRDRRKLAVYFLGIDYGDGVDLRKPNLGWTTPTLVLDGPETNFANDVADVTDQFYAGLTAAQNEAVKLERFRGPSIDDVVY